MTKQCAPNVVRKIQNLIILPALGSEACCWTHHSLENDGNPHYWMSKVEFYRSFIQHLEVISLLSITTVEILAPSTWDWSLCAKGYPSLATLTPSFEEQKDSHFIVPIEVCDELLMCIYFGLLISPLPHSESTIHYLGQQDVLTLPRSMICVLIALIEDLCGHSLYW